MLRVTLKSGKHEYSQDIDPKDYPPPRGMSEEHWTRAITIDGDDLEGLNDHFVAEFATGFAESEDCPHWLLDAGADGCTVTVGPCP